MSFRSHRPAASFAAFLFLTSPLGAGFALAQAQVAPRAAPQAAPPASSQVAPQVAQAPKPAKEPSVGQSAARERQKTCGAEWRALSVSDKAAQGPKWPQYFSKCVKRLKQIKA